MNSFPRFIFQAILVVMLISTSTLVAQDTIFTIRKKAILAKVIEINPRDVLYKKYNDLSGPTRAIDKRDLVKIVYANGFADTFNVRLAQVPEPVRIPPPPESDPRALDYFRNFAYITVTDLAMGIFTVGYDRTFNSGKSSFRIPVSIGLSGVGITKTSYDNTSPISPVFPSGAYYFSNKIFSTGIELNNYPKGQGTKRYFWGPAIAYGMYHYYSYSGVPESPGSFVTEEMTSQMLTIMLKNGVLWQPTKKTGISLFFGLGTTNLLDEPNSVTAGDYYYSYSFLKNINVEVGINAGIRF